MVVVAAHANELGSPERGTYAAMAVACAAVAAAHHDNGQRLNPSRVGVRSLGPRRPFPSRCIAVEFEHKPSELRVRTREAPKTFTTWLQAGVAFPDQLVEGRGVRGRVTGIRVPNRKLCNNSDS